MPDLRLRSGDRLGSQSVQNWIRTDAFGERYETVFGSTTHLLDVCVPPAGADAPTLADYRAFAARASAVRHPCVVRYFAAGESSPRPGAAPVPWLRGEHSDGASASIFQTAVDAADLPSDEDGPVVPTFGALLAASRGRLDPKDRDALLGDVLDGLAHLHSLGLACGHFDPEDVSLGRVRHRFEPIARLRVYAWPADAQPADASADLVLAAPLFRAALDASAETSKPREAEGLALFAESLEAGVFSTAADAAAAFGALCEKWGRPRAERTAPEEDPADDEDDAPAAARREPARPRPHRHHRRPSSNGGSEVMRRLMSLVRILLVVAFIVGVGVAVYFYLSGAAEEERRRLAALSGPPMPSIRVIPTERPAEERLAELPDSVFAYTASQLELAAGAEGDPRAPAAAVRAAIEALDEAGEPDAAAFDEAAARVAPALPALRRAADSDPAAALLLGRALLLGLGAPRDVAEGHRLVVQASTVGLHEADLVLGDLLSSDVALPGDRHAESRVERDRRAVVAWRRAAGSDTAPTPLLRAAADRIAPMLRAGRGIPPMNNDYPEWLGRLASAGHVPSIVALATPGGFAPDSPGAALNRLRDLSNAAGAPPALRAWALYRMGVMFERGEGLKEPNPAAALKRFRRAAEEGSGEAMLALAERLEKQRGSRDEAARWRERAAEAEPVPPLELRTVLVAPPAAVADRFRAAPRPAADGRTGTPEPRPRPTVKPLPKPGHRPAAKPAAAEPIRPLTEPDEPAPRPAAPKKPKKPAAGPASSAARPASRPAK